MIDTASATPATTGLSTRQRWLARFSGHRPILLTVIPTLETAQAAGEVEQAIKDGADGVFLINHGIGFQKFLPIAGEIAAAHPDLFLGVNCQDLRPQDVFYRLPPGIAAVWASDAGILPHSPETLAAIQQARRETGWEGFYFGGVSAAIFEHLTPGSLAVLKAGAELVDILTIGWPVNHLVPDRAATLRIRQAILNKPLAFVHNTVPQPGLFECLSVDWLLILSRKREIWQKRTRNSGRRFPGEARDKEA